MVWTNGLKRLVGGLTGAALLAVAGGAAAAEMPAPLSPPQKVKVAYVPILKFATMYVAAQRDLFKKHGLEVEFERVKSGTEAIAFLTQGSIDVGGIAIVTSLWNAWNRGMEIRIIAPGALEPFTNSPTQLLVRKALADEGKIKTVADLKGKRIATAGGPGSGGEYLAAKALERGQLTIRDVELINLGNADMPAALERGSIDAALAGSPYADQAINGGYASILATDLTPGLMTVAFVGSGKFIKERPQVAERFVLALAEAARLMQGKGYLDPANIEAYMTFTNTTEKAIREGNPVVYDPDLVVSFDGLRDVERVHRENGRLEYTQAIDLAAVADDQFVKKAIAVLGPYKK
ncbi:MAG: ABC transporter substrate-binding protein [Rhodospirillales bacterium]|jgi:NitT/TauT family transport system substrate-binding protein|nr:ABC transporter substrate-binding protein [Rhodospirillales bacterium]